MKPALYKKRHRTTRDPRAPKPWLGFVTLVVIIAIATGLAFGIQYAMGFTYEDFLRPLSGILFCLAFPGIVVGALVESSGHGISFQLHRTGEAICPFVNALVYTIVILLWLKFFGDTRLKK